MIIGINMLEMIYGSAFSPFQWEALGIGGLICFIIIIPLVILFVIAY